MKYLFYFLFFTVALSAQNITVLSADTREPVPFVTIILKTNGKVTGGLYCGENGTADINAAYETAEFSCLGFETQVIDKAKVEKMVYLKPKAIVLEGVTISKKLKKVKPVALGNIKAKKSVDVMAMQGAESVLFIGNPMHEQMLIESFSFRGFTAKGYKFAFRLHFYKLDTATNGPGEEIIHEDIVCYVDGNSKRTVETDVSAYNVIMPADGVFAGIEWLSCEGGDGVVAGAKDYKWYNSSVEYTAGEQTATYYRQRLDGGKWKKTELLHNAAYSVKVTSY